MMDLGDMGRRYYRLGLAAAKRRDLSAALRYAVFARILNPGHGEAARLEEICRYELGESIEALRDPELEGIRLLAGQKKWKAAAAAAKALPHQSVRLLNVQACFWALAKRYALAADCFTKALVKDRGNTLALEALAELGPQGNRFWRFFCSFSTLAKRKKAITKL
jgi:tetratricopeptide (TPR) repeat protein